MSIGNNKPRQLHLQIIDTLRQRIKSGVYSPEEQFPTEFELAEEFDVSRGTMRRALQTLVDDGVLSRIQGKGTFINSNIPPVSTLGRSNLLGIAIPNIHDPLSTNIINGVQPALREHGYSLIFCDLEGNLDRESEQFGRLRAHRVAGVIVFPLAIPGELELLQELHDSRIPVVLVDRQVPGFPGPTIMADNYQGAYDAVTHLLELGHRRIVCVRHPSPASSVLERIRGYEQAMRDAGLLPYAPVAVLSGGWKIEERTPPVYPDEDMAMVDHMLSVQDPPTAAFCVNDYLAIGVMRHAFERGMQVPDDLSIVGFDNNPFAQLAAVPLTTIAQPTGEIGAKAIEVLLQRIAGEPIQNETILLPTSLIVRASTQQHSS